MDVDDDRLLARIQEGDGESFGELYDRTHGWLRSFVVLPRVGAAEADEVLSETYRTALQRIGSFEWRGVGLLHWLAAIARRKALERLRRLSRRASREASLPDLLDPADDSPTAEAEMIRLERLAQLRSRVEKTLGSLPPRYAAALRMRLLEGKGREECARLLAVSVGTFDVVLHRASRAFARKWTPA